MVSRSTSRNQWRIPCTIGAGLCCLVPFASSAAEVKLGGRLMLDVARYHSDVAPLHNGSEIRRARIELEGELQQDIEYQLEVDFAGDEAELKDAWFGHAQARHRWRMGQFKEPFSLEEVTSSKALLFMERALPNALAPGRNIGIDYRYATPDWQVTAGLFGEDSGSSDDAEDGANESFAMGVRVSGTPWRVEDDLLHLGLAVNYRDPGGMAEADFDSRPESHITDMKFVDTGDINDVKAVWRGGAELAWILGPFALQGEYLEAQLERSQAADLRFNGSYLTLRWGITGERYRYKVAKGAFSRLRPADGSAWELALRSSYIDLQSEDVAGGVERNTAFGLNWYPQRHMRFMLNLVQVDTQPSVDGVDDKPWLWQLRGEVDF